MPALAHERDQRRQQYDNAGKYRTDVQRAAAGPERQPDANERNAHREQDRRSGSDRPGCVLRRGRRLGTARRRLIISCPPVSRVCQSKEEQAGNGPCQARRDDAEITH